MTFPEERRNQSSIFQNPRVAWFVTVVTWICTLAEHLAPIIATLPK